MTTAERITAINAYGQTSRENAFLEAERKKNEHDEKLISLKAYGPRIGALLDVAAALVKNGIHLGKPENRSISSCPHFITDGIRHGFGFKLERSFYLLHGNAKPLSGGIPESVGFEGGGWNGEDFLVNRNGAVIAGANHKRFDELHANFINKFDAFEKEFYNWIDSLTKQ